MGICGDAMRICLVYDCLFPHTVGGAERWYRNLAERLAADGHEVTYLTLRQWDRGVDPGVPGVDVRVVGPRMKLYDGPGHRRILPPLVFGAGVLAHLGRHGGRYDVVHTASFPYFSLLAAAVARPWRRFRLVVDWHEVWTRQYWREYLGWLGGDVGWLVQRVCVMVPQTAFCFSNLHAQRLREEGLRGTVTKLPGEYEGPVEIVPGERVEPLALFAGRHIPEKRVPAIPPAIQQAREVISDLRGLILGDGPDRQRVLAQVAALGLTEVVEVPGFVDTAVVEEAMLRAMCLLLPSRREGYGLVVLEAAARGTPSIVVAGPDNAAVELITEGENGFIAASDSPADLAAAIEAVHAGSSALRASTRRWFAAHAELKSLTHSLEVVLSVYSQARPGRGRALRAHTGT
jgi:glycosyltransferase involved in cell wall biosynthesis